VRGGGAGPGSPAVRSRRATDRSRTKSTPPHRGKTLTGASTAC
jgi:hypothetical protein